MFRQSESFNLEETWKEINEYWMNRNYYNSDTDIFITENEKEESVKIADSKNSDKFIKKSDAESSFNYKKVWI